jgi:hypothetical protein
MARRWIGQMTDTVAMGALLLMAVGVVAVYVVATRLGGVRKSGQLQRRDERRHAEQLEWRRSRRLPARYVTIYEPGEMVDEDMARMLELGYYVAEDADLVSGHRRVIYRLRDVSAL